MTQPTSPAVDPSLVDAGLAALAPDDASPLARALRRRAADHAARAAGTTTDVVVSHDSMI